MSWEDTRLLKMKEFQALQEHMNDQGKAQQMRARAGM